MSAPTHSEMAWAIMEAEALSAAFGARARAYRRVLQADAEQYWREHGAAPTWRVPELGTVTLPIQQEGARVTHEESFVAWVQARFPAAVTVRTVVEVTPSFGEELLGGLAHDGDGAMVDPNTGEIVPGVAYVPGDQPRPVSIRGGKRYRDTYGAMARAMVDACGLPPVPELPPEPTPDAVQGEPAGPVAAAESA